MHHAVHQQTLLQCLPSTCNTEQYVNRQWWRAVRRRLTLGHSDCFTACNASTNSASMPSTELHHRAMLQLAVAARGSSTTNFRAQRPLYSMQRFNAFHDEATMLLTTRGRCYKPTFDAASRSTHHRKDGEELLQKRSLVVPGMIGGCDGVL